MFNVRNIISNNNATFYDYNSRKKLSQKRRMITTCVVAVVATFVFPDISNDLLAGFLTVQSILLGFTYNVMFFLLGSREKKIEPESSIIEVNLRASRLRDLYRELFYNVSYFNVVALASIIIALLLLLPTPAIPQQIYKFLHVRTFGNWVETYKLVLAIKYIFRSGAVFLFYTISIEVIFSIARVIGRTSFYFERKMEETQQFDNQDQR